MGTRYMNLLQFIYIVNNVKKIKNKIFYKKV